MGVAVGIGDGVSVDNAIGLGGMAVKSGKVGKVNNVGVGGIALGMGVPVGTGVNAGAQAVSARMMKARMILVFMLWFPPVRMIELPNVSRIITKTIPVRFLFQVLFCALKDPQFLEDCRPNTFHASQTSGNHRSSENGHSQKSLSIDEQIP